MIKNTILQTFFVGALTLIASHCFAMRVQIFTDDAHPVTVGHVDKNVHVDYYNLSQLQRLLHQMNAAISTQNPAVAEAQAKRLMQTYRLQLRHAVEGILYVHQYHIKKIPAFVFDKGAYRVLGQMNLQTAIQDYLAWKKHTN